MVVSNVYGEARYIADTDCGDFCWTANFERARRFKDRAEAERLFEASPYTAWRELVKQNRVWFLK